MDCKGNAIAIRHSTSWDSLVRFRAHCYYVALYSNDDKERSVGTGSGAVDQKSTQYQIMDDGVGLGFGLRNLRCPESRTPIVFWMDSEIFDMRSPGLFIIWPQRNLWLYATTNDAVKRHNGSEHFESSNCHRVQIYITTSWDTLKFSQETIFLLIKQSTSHLPKCNQQLAVQIIVSKVNL